MIDLVLSHTSDQHPWFKESRKDRSNPKADWFVWADPKPDGTPPNNWLSVFGGSAWHWDGRRQQYYLHNFLTAQPDLNFHEPAVVEALLDVARFWLERGVDGFRLDTINFYIADKYLRDNPPLPPELRNNTIAPSVNPYNHQLHIFSKNQPENLEFLRKFRAVLNPYNAAAVGEVGDAQRGLEIMAEYTSGGDKVQMCYPFEMLQPARLTADSLVETFARLETVSKDFWPCWAFSNHDVIRHATRWGLTDAGIRAYATLLVTLRGSICLYQGEELGLPEAEIAFENLQDPYGIEFWPEFKGRDGCRTPMVWVRDNATGGFSTGRPWLPVPAEHLSHAANVQDADAGSVLSHYRRALAFRRAHPALVAGGMSDLTATGGIARFRRSGAGEEIFVAVNLSGGAGRIAVPEGDWTVTGAELDSQGLAADGMIDLGPWQVCLLRRAVREGGN
jgi:alpha-glucosidase